MARVVSASSPDEYEQAGREQAKADLQNYTVLLAPNSDLWNRRVGIVFGRELGRHHEKLMWKRMGQDDGVSDEDAHNAYDRGYIGEVMTSQGPRRLTPDAEEPWRSAARDTGVNPDHGVVVEAEANVDEEAA